MIFLSLLRNKIVLIFFVIVFVLLVFFALSSSFFKQPGSKDPVKSPEPSSGQKTVFNIPVIDNSVRSRIGETKEESIASQPDLISKREVSNSETEYSFKSPRTSRVSPQISRNNEIVTENGVVVFERIVTTDQTNLLDFKKILGEPEITYQGSKYYGKFETLYLYPDKGVALLGNPFSGEIDEVQIFLPTTKEEYLVKWGQDLDTDSSTMEDLGN